MHISYKSKRRSLGYFCNNGLQSVAFETNKWRTVGSVYIRTVSYGTVDLFQVYNYGLKSVVIK